MVEKGDRGAGQELGGQNANIRNLPRENSLHTLSSFITTEEHAIAWLHQSKIRVKKRINRVRITERIVKGEKIKKLDTNSLAPLSIEFNVNGRTETSKQSSDPKNSSTTSVNNSSQVVQEEPTNEVSIVPEEESEGQYLLKWSEVS